MTAELAIRLAAALRGSAESWLRMQLARSLWNAQKRRRPKIQPLDSRVISGWPSRDSGRAECLKPFPGNRHNDDEAVERNPLSL